jgi:hypothetical protein
MSGDNKHNLLYFESPSMRELHDCMEKWQIANRKRFLSVCIQQDGEQFCCIALSNPIEVIVTGPNGSQAEVVNSYGRNRLSVASVS